MKLTMTNGFCELNENEMNEINGGVNDLKYAGGCLCVIIGGAAAAYGAITYNAELIVSGINAAAYDSGTIYDSMFE